MMANDKETLTKILDESIFRVEITDPTVVWFSERLEWLVNRLLDAGVIIPGSAEWVPLGGYERDEQGHRFTHYCSKCGQLGFSNFPRCPKCASDMGAIIEPPILEKEMIL